MVHINLQRSAVAMVFVLCTAAHAQHVQSLTLLPGATDAYIWDISQDGQILAGECFGSAPNSSGPTIWTAPDYQPTRVNVNGVSSFQGPVRLWVVSPSGKGLAGNDYAGAVFVWWDGANKPPQQFGSWFLPDLGSMFAEPVLLSEDNSVVVVQASPTHPFRVLRRDGSITVYPYPDDAIYNFPVTCSANGSRIVANVEFAFSGSAPVVWRNAVPERMPRPAGLDGAWADWISPDGYTLRGGGYKIDENGKAADFTGLQWNFSYPDWTVEPAELKLQGRRFRSTESALRDIGFLPGTDSFIIRDRFHGTRDLSVLLPSLFPSIAGNSPASYLFPDGRRVLGPYNTPWIGTLPDLTDLNEDRVRDNADVSIFLDALSLGTSNADWNQDGQLTFEDVDAFVDDFEAGR